MHMYIKYKETDMFEAGLGCFLYNLFIFLVAVVLTNKTNQKSALGYKKIDRARFSNFIFQRECQRWSIIYAANPRVCEQPVFCLFCLFCFLAAGAPVEGSSPD